MTLKCQMTNNNDRYPAKILLVDDRRENLLSLELVLQAGNYQFANALSGREALKILLKEQDFALILDIFPN